MGDRVTQNFLVPLDPESVLQRTGTACIGDIGHIVNSENIDEFYVPSPECHARLNQFVGTTNLEMTWERIEWNKHMADLFRYGPHMSETADLQPKLQDLIDDINIGYVYIEEDSCALLEGGAGLNRGCIKSAGWRQLLRFSSTVVNVGKTPLNIGDVHSNQYIERGK